jgi:hypothetical protein
MKVNFLLLALITLLAACKTEKEKEYFPFQSFLQNELNQIDSLPIAIFKYSNRNNHTDTSIVEKKQFREITSALLNIDLLKEDNLDAYTELVLEDTDIDNINISYTTDNKKLPIKQLQLNIKPGTALVKSFYVERIDQINDLTILRKILWTSQKGVTITSLYYKNNKVKEQLTEKYSWSIQ